MSRLKTVLIFALTSVLASGLAAVPMVAGIRWQPVNVNVRWAAGVSVNDRSAAEGQFGLTNGAHQEDTTWRYLLTDHSTGNISALVSDSRVEDTQNLDRQAFRPVDVPWNFVSIALEAMAVGFAAALVLLVGGRLVSRQRFWAVLATAWGALAVRPIAELPQAESIAAALPLALACAFQWHDDGLRRWLRSARSRVVQGVAACVALERTVLVGVALLTTAVLLLTARHQVYDAQHFLLTPATSILAGDRPYREFFETGLPLGSYSAAGFQWLFGHRLLGEFVRQWIFIVAGTVLAFHLGLRLSRSTAATMATLPITLLVLADTPTYHESKLFFFPLMVWAGWRYIERPDVRRAVVVALVTATAFLSRHDYGIYLGFASVAAFALARLAVPASRNLRSAIWECAAYAIVIAAVLAPWAIVVQANEGLIEYTRSRSQLNQPAPRDRYLALLSINPLRQLGPTPAPRPAQVSFKWRNEIDEARRQQLEHKYGLRLVKGPEMDGRWRYEVPNLYDVSFFELDRHLLAPDGFDWEALLDIRAGRTSRNNAMLWLLEMGMLLPIVLLAAATWHICGGLRRSEVIPLDAWLMVFAGIFVAVLEWALLREPSYIAVVTPLMAALSARFLASGNRFRQAVAIVAIALTTYAAFVVSRRTGLFGAPRVTVKSTLDALTRLTTLPPEYNDTFTYLRQCSVPGDRILVTGNTPLHVSYYAQRPIAGGHIMWHYGWRSDQAHEAQSLALLHRQSVPFVVSTSDPVLRDFKKYPRIHAYLLENYAEVDNTGGMILVDMRRSPTGRYGPMGLPCFR